MRVNSSHVEEIQWDPATQLLEVTYGGAGRRRRTYVYVGVSYEIWVQLQKAASKGSFLRTRIQPVFAAREMA